MNPAEQKKVEKRVNRFRVFGYVKSYMDKYGECPTSAEVSAGINMPLSTARQHMVALTGADGLPMDIEDGKIRMVKIHTGNSHNVGPKPIDLIGLKWGGLTDD